MYFSVKVCDTLKTIQIMETKRLKMNSNLMMLFKNS